MDIVKICALALLCTFASLLLKSIKSEWGMLCALCGGVLILFFVLGSLSESVLAIREMTLQSGFSEYSAVLFRALGISLVATVGADACREAGSASLASKIELAGRVLILSLCIPLLRELISLALEVLK